MTRSLVLALIALGLAVTSFAADRPDASSGSGARLSAQVPGRLPSLAPPPGRRFVPGEVLVALAPGDRLLLGADGYLASRDGRVAELLARHGVARFVEFPEPRLGPAGPRTRFAKLMSARPDFDPVRAASELRASGAVRAAVPNYLVEPFTTMPNDPYLGQQWAIYDAGDADIQLPEAWDIEKGNASTVIAIMDLGVDTGHPDLTSKIWVNAGEVLNGLDDDGNGLVDDVQGWDFGDADNDPNPHAVLDDIGLDEGFHGTFVAGIAAAATNNGTGIAGAGWDCKIMPLKIVDVNGETRMDALTGAFQYVAGKRPAVLSMSFGAKPDSGVADYFQALVDQVVSAGVTCVAAAGNDSSDTLSYPAACRDVIAVAATDQTNTRAWFSNWGSWVDVAAPGTGIWSTLCRNYAIDFGSQLIYYLYFGWDGVNPYMYGDGTSMSCPLVAGVCGLLHARAPGITPQEIEARLVATGHAIASDHPIGVKVNAFRALDGLAVEAETLPSPWLALAAAPNPFGVATTVRFVLPCTGDARLALYDVSGRLVRELVHGTLTAGPHAVIWDARDSDGRRVPSGIYFAQLAGGGAATTARLLFVR